MLLSMCKCKLGTGYKATNLVVGRVVTTGHDNYYLTCYHSI